MGDYVSHASCIHQLSHIRNKGHIVHYLSSVGWAAVFLQTPELIEGRIAARKITDVHQLCSSKPRLRLHAAMRMRCLQFQDNMYQDTIWVYIFLGLLCLTCISLTDWFNCRSIPEATLHQLYMAPFLSKRSSYLCQYTPSVWLVFQSLLPLNQTSLHTNTSSTYILCTGSSHCIYLPGNTSLSWRRCSTWVSKIAWAFMWQK